MLSSSKANLSAQEYQEQAQEARRIAREDAARAAEEGNHIEPLSGVAQRRLKQGRPYELQGRDVRPGVMSRYPHSFQAYQATLDDLQVCKFGTAGCVLGVCLETLDCMSLCMPGCHCHLLSRG